MAIIVLSLLDEGIPNAHMRPEIKHGVQNIITTATSIATVIVMRNCLELSADSLCSDSDTETCVGVVVIEIVVIVAELVLRILVVCFVLIGLACTRGLADRIITEAYAIDIMMDMIPR